MITKARIKLAIAYRTVTRSAKPWPSAFGNCSRVTNSGAMYITDEKTNPIRAVIVKEVFGFIVTSNLYPNVKEIIDLVK